MVYIQKKGTTRNNESIYFRGDILFVDEILAIEFCFIGKFHWIQLAELGQKACGADRERWGGGIARGASF